MTTLTTFLLARIAEDEKPCVCLERFGGACGGGWCRDDCRPCSGGDAYTSDEFRLAECEAKRCIVEMARFSDSPESAVDAWLELDRPDVDPGPAIIVLTDVLRTLALPYADHEQFREEWR